ncbi:alpha/beta hydrolase [Dactylosporangium cerinum]|uniref:Alpha/beta hydrolase n=1 Tax=Dactylosporangium cerinum TaxID=1434730 RepID=A0ABV9W8L6_9ACTN
MDAAFVLVHSPLVGPLTWAPVAATLRALQRTAVVPSLLGATDGHPPFWPQISARVAGAGLPSGAPLVVVAHSNAGYFVPVIVEALRGTRRVVAGSVIVDGALPARTGPTRVVAPGLLDRLLPRVVDGRLPQWSAWWDEDPGPLFPDPETRRAVEAEQPRLPLTYYDQQVPVPAGWDSGPCGYLRFSEHYEPAAREARDRGWAVAHVPGLHLHQLVDPETVAARLVAMTGRW